MTLLSGSRRTPDKLWPWIDGLRCLQSTLPGLHAIALGTHSFLETEAGIVGFLVRQPMRPRSGVTCSRRQTASTGQRLLLRRRRPAPAAQHAFDCTVDPGQALNQADHIAPDRHDHAAENAAQRHTYSQNPYQFWRHSTRSRVVDPVCRPLNSSRRPIASPGCDTGRL